MNLDTAKVKAIRERKELTQTAAAAKAGKSPQWWNNVESGRVGAKRGVSFKTIDTVAKALGVKAKDLLK